MTTKIQRMTTPDLEHARDAAEDLGNWDLVEEIDDELIEREEDDGWARMDITFAACGLALLGSYAS